MKTKRTISAIISMFAITFLLSGCGGVEPEKRDYPLALAWDYEEGNYEVTYSMANLAQMTGQDKSGEESPAALQLKAKSLEDLQKEYAKSQQYYLDMGHVQAVIFGNSLLRNLDEYENVIKGMQKNPVLGKSTYVFATENPDEVMKISTQTSDTIGEYLSGVYENHMGGNEQAKTLEDVYYDWDNKGKTTDFPEIRIEGNQVIVCGKE